MLTKKKFHDIFIVDSNNSMGLDLDILHRIGDGWPIVPLIRSGVLFKEYTLLFEILIF
jgi:hypothetical protein